MNASGLRRNIKNIVHNYSEAQVKVREATSNDPWGPSSTIMSEIADLTYNVVAFSEIMQMIWKRLNDHGKNWRHVYKALMLLEYLIKTGTEKVAQQCKENIFAIQTLKDFQYIEDNKDQGINVREKAKQLVSLLKDDERLKNERARALKAKERFAQATSGIGNESGSGRIFSDSFGASVNGPDSPPELENARPQTAGEEELQLQLALAMSKEEADQEEQKRRSDDVRLQMAITQSQEDFKVVQEEAKKPSALLDLLDVGGAASAEVTAISNSRNAPSDPWGMPLQQNRPLASDPWGSPPNNRAASTSPVHSDPWAPKTTSRSHTPNANFGSHNDPWSSVTSAPAPAPVPVTAPVIPPPGVDPWGVPPPTAAVASSVSAFGSTPSLSTNGDVDGFDLLSSRAVPSKSTNNLDSLGGLGLGANPFDMNSMQQNLPKTSEMTPIKKTPESFLGENSALVNLEALVSSKPPDQMGGTTNPFANAGQNPFQLQQQQQQQQRVSINQLRSQQQFTTTTNTAALGYSLNLNTPLPPPAGQAATLGGSPSVNNPFL